MLDHLGLTEASQAVETAVIADLASREPGVPLTTAQIGDRIAGRVAG